MEERKNRPQSVREFLEQWPRAKRSTANAGITSIRIRGPKKFSKSSPQR